MVAFRFSRVNSYKFEFSSAVVKVKCAHSDASLMCCAGFDKHMALISTTFMLTLTFVPTAYGGDTIHGCN